MRRSTVAVFILVVTGVAGAPDEAPILTHGVASGDVTANSAILWARANAACTLQVEYAMHPTFLEPKKGPSFRVSERSDFTGQTLLSRLRPFTRYYYRMRAQKGELQSPPCTGSFITAPEPDDSQDVRFLWAGDLGGQGFCRKSDQGYEIFKVMTQLTPDFVLFSGDMIYADSPCPTPPNLPGSDFLSTTLADYRQRWKYNRGDAHHQKLLATTSMVSQWDDHEVVNDFAGPSEPRTPIGRQAYFEYHPILRSRDEEYRIYRKFRWGKELELFVLDNRQYRALNTQPDGPTKSMLGRKQFDWLVRSLSRSHAVWKAIATSVPLTVPTGTSWQTNGRDGWANGSTAIHPEGDKTGWENELLALFKIIRERTIQNVVWITTDVHFAQFARLDPFRDGKPISYELICGPLSAIALKPGELDTTLRPTRIYAEGEFFNFGLISIDPTTHKLTAQIRTSDYPSRPVVRHTLVLDAVVRSSSGPPRL